MNINLNEEQSKLLVECIEDLKTFEEGYAEILQDALEKNKVGSSSKDEMQHQLITTQLKVFKLNDLIAKLKGE